MSTKLYLHDAANTLSGTFPSGEQSSSFTPEWTATGATTLRKMDTSIGAAQASLAGTTVANTSTQRGLLGMWVSPPLSGAQTVGGGNMTFNAADKESDLNANFAANAPVVYVWRPSTGAKVGTVSDGASLNGLEGGTSESVSHRSGITSTAVSANDGDVVVYELWSVFNQSAAASYTATLYYDGTTENTTENAAVSNHASFLELAETLTFQVVPDAKSGTDTLTPSVSESVAILCMADRADTLTPGLGDASALLSLLGRADTLTPAVADGGALLALLTRSDVLTPGLVEAGAVAVVLAGSDTLTPALDDGHAVLALLARSDTLTPSLVGTIWPDLPGMALRVLTVTLRAADGTPQAGATVRALRVRVGGGLRTVVSPAAVTAVTDGAGVAVLTLLPSFGDAYRIIATAADGRPLLDVAVLLDGNANLHELTPLEGMTWH